MAISQWRIDLIKDVQAIQLFNPHVTDTEIASREGMKAKYDHLAKDGLTKNVIIAARRDYKNHQETVITTPPLLKQWTKNKYEYVSIELPRYDIDPVFEGDFMCIGDIHLPSTNWLLSDVMLQVAKKHLHKPKFIIFGDLFNLDSLSAYETVVPIERLQAEINIGKGYLESLMAVGDVYVLPGNHDYRWSRKLEGKLSIMQLWELVQHGMKTGNIQFYPDTGAWVRSGKQKWRGTHQRNYSRIKLRVANTLSLMRQSNMMTFHEHHKAVGMNDNGLYAIVNNGGLHESPAIHFCNWYDSTSPVMTNGFNMLRDGICYDFTPYEQLTDYGMWDIDASALFAHERKKQAIYLGNYTRDAEGIIQIGKAA